MKVGIISELNTHNANYGNRLQAYALNNYLNTKYNNQNYTFESLYFNFYDKKKITKIYPNIIINKFIDKFKNRFLNSKKYSEEINERIKKANDFTFTNIKLSHKEFEWNDLVKSDYDAFIVGSDIVWLQAKGKINRIRFLDFTASKKFKKYSYAASFGNNIIPNENKKELKKMLSTFKYISVREKNSIELLKSIGINNVLHVLDPTLLLSNTDWSKIEKKIQIKEKYIFTYLLGNDESQKIIIKKFAKKNNLKIINIENANEIIDNKTDDYFTDKKINCSPEEWIYLIHNAEYIITDSFHGVVFSTIFNKKFFALKRNSKKDLNNRITDYLNTINQEDKYVNSLETVEKLTWDYEKTNAIIKNLKDISKKYLQAIVEDISNE